MVHREDRDLFSMADFGITGSGLRATQIDLDMPAVPGGGPESDEAALLYFVWVFQDTDKSDLLAVIDLPCPDWFEPERRRLALNEVRWLDTTVPPNNMADFDPWSRSVLRQSYIR
jgi:hypothetical protein